ncbi:hypothetical protein KY359_03550, partial [Candidatus Woesearchaeota archaeon]|nr:hypothetical protein [Candidatus Woesearchaeota archaeon]
KVMKFNAFDHVTPSIDDMKRLLFPFSFRNWLKLGLVSLLAGGGRGGFNPGSGLNIKVPSGSSGSVIGADNVTELNKITGGVADSLKSTLGVWYYLILPILSVIVVLGVVMTYITSVFAFMFLEALDTRKVMIRKSWKKNKPLGWSFFLFRIVIGLIVLGLIALAALPMIIPMLQQGFFAYFENFSMWNLAWMIPAISLLIIIFIVIGLFMALVYNFSMVHMYFRQMPAWASVKATFRKMGKAKLEVFVFLLAKLVINIVAGICAVLLIILMLLPFLLIALPFGLIFWGLVTAFGWTAAVIAGMAAVGLAWFTLFAYVFSVIFLPVSTFARYFSIHNYKALMKQI